jgi:hypothetical protein
MIWDYFNQEIVEINIVRDQMNSINNNSGIDMFIDRHSQANEVSWYNYTYASSGNIFFPILSDWTPTGRILKPRIRADKLLSILLFRQGICHLGVGKTDVRS